MQTLTGDNLGNYRGWGDIGFPSKSESFLQLAVKIFLIYACIYGTVAIYVDNVMIRALKDFALILLFAYSLLRIRQEAIVSPIIPVMQFALVSICAIGAVGFLSGNDLVTYGYGLKVTILPMGLLFLGIVLYRSSMNLNKMLVFLSLILVTAWIFQNIVGVERLITQYGMEYGVNVRNYVDGTPRYPSLVGTPGGFSYVLAIVSIIISRSEYLIRRPWLSLLFNSVTFLILILATIRSALFFWAISHLVIYLLNTRIQPFRARLFRYSMFLLLTPCAFLIWSFNFSSTSLTDPSSFYARISHWTGSIADIFATWQGMTGDGLGAVGAASRRTATLGFDDSLNYAVDNQGLAILLQTGLLGFIVFNAFYFAIAASILRSFRHGNSYYTITALALMAGTVCAGFFSNVLESYPFNLFLWLIVGLALGEQIYTSSSRAGNQDPYVRGNG